MPCTNLYESVLKPIGWFITATALLLAPSLICTPLIFYGKFLSSFLSIGLILSTSYLMGSIPFGYLFTKWAGLGDIRKTGSGNIGATNALRTGNKTVALFTLLFDFAKGYTAVWIAYYFSTAHPSIELTTTIPALIVILGHIFPIWLRFKGGKGVATALGTYFYFSPILGFMTVIIWAITAKIFKISSLSALVAFVATAIIMPLLCYYDVFLPTYSNFITWYLITVALLILFTHRGNIRRLLTGQEGQIKVTSTP